MVAFRLAVPLMPQATVVSSLRRDVDPPRSFFQYIKSMGPGIVVILTWLGAGDLVGAAAAGGNYGYSLMWVFVLCLVLRWLFVSIIAKYQLCNQHGENVLGGLIRLHPLYGPFVFVSALMLGHAGGAYMLIGAARRTDCGHAKRFPHTVRD